jgi:hypothetical protein
MNFETKIDQKINLFLHESQMSTNNEEITKEIFHDIEEKTTNSPVCFDYSSLYDNKPFIWYNISSGFIDLHDLSEDEKINK